LQAIADVFDDVGAVLIWRREENGFGTIVSPKLHAGQLEYEKHWWRHDIRTIRGAEVLYAEEKNVLSDYDVVSQEEIDTHPIYTEFLPSLGIGWFGAASVAPASKVDLMVSVQRAKAKGPFSQAELATVYDLSRHVEKSFRLSMRLFEAERLNIGSMEALDGLDIGVVVIDAKRRIVFSNPRSQHLLRLVVKKETLNFSSASVRDSFERAIRGCYQPTDLLHPFVIEPPDSRTPTIAYFFPIGRSPRSLEGLLTRARAIGLLFEDTPDEPADPAFLRDLLGLTLGEARIAALVGHGISPKLAAEKLGIAESTARTALKRVFSKTGVSRQSELAALLGRIARHSVPYGRSRKN
jgi:DNA-binding CsgD family transcriptional regulator/PAS domain-containing protein